MGSGVMNKIKALMGIEDGDYEDEELDYIDDEEVEEKETTSIWGRKNKVAIIVNLEYVNKDVARRIIDFMSGAVYALDGNIQKISNSIFLIAPCNYEITNELSKEVAKEKAPTNTVSWIK